MFSDLCIEAQQDASANGFAGRLSGGNWTGALILLPLKVLDTSPSQYTLDLTCTKYSSPSRYLISCTWYSIHYAICGSRHDGPYISVIRRRDMSFGSQGSIQEPLGDNLYIFNFNDFWKLLLDTLPPQGTSHLIVETWLDNCPPKNLILDQYLILLPLKDSWQLLCQVPLEDHQALHKDLEVLLSRGESSPLWGRRLAQQPPLNHPHPFLRLVCTLSWSPEKTVAFSSKGTPRTTTSRQGGNYETTSVKDQTTPSKGKA